MLLRCLNLRISLCLATLIGLVGTVQPALSQQRGDPAPSEPATTPDEPPGAIPTPAQTPGVTPEPDSLFVPLVPGATPEPTPEPPKQAFTPSEIPAPVIQATPEEVEIEDPDQFGGEALTLETRRATTPPPPPPPPIATPTPQPKTTTSSGTRTYQRTSGSTTRSSTAAASSVSQAISGERLAQLMTQARVNRDAKIATQVGWAQFNRKDYPSAEMWFEQAISWNSDLGEAYYGLALTKFTQGDISQAEAIAGYRTNAYPKMRALMGDILIRRAMDDYNAKDYAGAAKALNKATEYRSLGRAERIIQGWCYYYLKDYQSAANIFESLYRARPDKPSAEGLYAALSRMKDWQRLELVASEVPGPLNEIYMTYDTENYYKSGLYLAAYNSNEKAYPALRNFDSPAIGVGFEYSQKSGQEGESKLTTTRAPVVDFRFSPAERVWITAKVARLELDSGDPSDGALIGTPPEEFQPFATDITTSYNDLYEVKARIEYQDWLTPYLELGGTPFNAELSARLIGKAGVQYRHNSGYIQAEVYSQPIRESVLSYVGLEDPYVPGDAWGRVQETGGSLQVFQGFMEDFTFFAKASYGTITGTNTYENNHLSLIASISKLFDYEGFEYITIGPAFSYERFDNNQNHFTYGHGGYFSPQYIVQGIIEAQFLTTEGQNWLLTGAIGAGAQQNNQAAAAYFPLDPDGREYEGTNSSTGIFLVRAEGGILLTPEWMIGAKLSYAITADYDEGFASIYVRYFFEPRAGLFRPDIDFSYW